MAAVCILRPTHSNISRVNKSYHRQRLQLKQLICTHLHLIIKSMEGRCALDLDTSVKPPQIGGFIKRVRSQVLHQE